MKGIKYKGKTESVSDLPEAYRLVAKLESVKKQTENQKAFKRVQEYKSKFVTVTNLHDAYKQVKQLETVAPY